jgi:hypothetical protein
MLAAVKLLVDVIIAVVFALSSFRSMVALRRDDAKRQPVVGLPLSRASHV